MSEGYVHILSNESMPGLVKIGRSISSGRNRAKEIYQTGVPTPFKLEFELYCDDCVELEHIVHQRLERNRPNPNREFFKLEVYEAIQAVMGEFAGYHDLSVIYADYEIDESVYFNITQELKDQGIRVNPLHIPAAINRMTADSLTDSLIYLFELYEKDRSENG